MKQLDQKFARLARRAQAGMPLVEVPGLIERVRPLRVQVRNLLFCRVRQLPQTQSRKNQ